MKHVESVSIKRLGLTLIEAIVVLLIVTVVIAGALSLFTQISRVNAVTEIAKQVLLVRDVVRTSYAGTASFAGLNMANLSSSFPAQMWDSDNSVLRHAGGGSIEVLEEGFHSTYFVVRLTNIPQNICDRLVLTDLGARRIQLSGGVVKTISGEINRSLVEEFCNVSTTIVRFEFER